jgi:uncharacterized membrane protein YfcA
MDGTLYLFLLLVGLSVGFLSGLLGIGGGIVMSRSIYVPPGPWQHRRKGYTGITMAQGFLPVAMFTTTKRARGWCSFCARLFTVPLSLIGSLVSAGA